MLFSYWTGWTLWIHLSMSCLWTLPHHFPSTYIIFASHLHAHNSYTSTISTQRFLLSEGLSWGLSRLKCPLVSAYSLCDPSAQVLTIVHFRCLLTGPTPLSDNKLLVLLFTVALDSAHPWSLSVTPCIYGNRWEILGLGISRGECRHVHICLTNRGEGQQATYRRDQRVSWEKTQTVGESPAMRILFYAIAWWADGLPLPKKLR